MTDKSSRNKASRQLPTILIVCGAWHIPEHYKPLILQLESLGYTVECPRLPTTSGIIPPISDVNDDADFIRKIAIQHLEQGRDLVPLLHSWGGSVGTRAFSGLGRNDRNATGSGSVLHLVYLTAFVPAMDDLPLSGLRSPPPYEDHSTAEKDGMVSLHKNLAKEFFYGDVSPEDVALAVSMLVPMPAGFLDQLFTGTKPLAPAYETIPTTYILCEQDKAVLPMVQEMMIENIKRGADTGMHVNTVGLNCSHSPFVSMPMKLASIMDDCVKGILG